MAPSSGFPFPIQRYLIYSTGWSPLNWNSIQPILLNRSSQIISYRAFMGYPMSNENIALYITVDLPIPDEGQWGSVNLNYFWIAPHSMVNTAMVAEDGEIMISE